MASTTNSTRVKAPASGTADRPATRQRRVQMATDSQSPRDGVGSIRTRPSAPKTDLRIPIRIATWNVLTLNGTGYQVALVRELKRYKIAIAGLTEARLSGSGEHDVQDGHLLYSGGTEKRNGVALVLRPPFNKALTMWHPLSDRLLYARLAHKHGHISIIVAYAPTNEATDSDKDRFHDELSTTTQTVPPHDKLLVIGDLNAVSGEATN